MGDQLRLFYKHFCRRRSFSILSSLLCSSCRRYNIYIRLITSISTDDRYCKSACTDLHARTLARPLALAVAIRSVHARRSCNSACLYRLTYSIHSYYDLLHAHDTMLSRFLNVKQCVQKDHAASLGLCCQTKFGNRIVTFKPTYRVHAATTQRFTGNYRIFVLCLQK